MVRIQKVIRRKKLRERARRLQQKYKQKPRGEIIEVEHEEETIQLTENLPAIPTAQVTSGKDLKETVNVSSAQSLTSGKDLSESIDESPSFPDSKGKDLTETFVVTVNVTTP